LGDATKLRAAFQAGIPRRLTVTGSVEAACACFGVGPFCGDAAKVIEGAYAFASNRGQRVEEYMFEKEIVAVISRVIELSGVIILVLGLLAATLRFLFRGTSESEDISPYQQYRRDMGRAILLGLEVLVAADIISTVTISPTLESVFVLAIIVLVRTFLSFSIGLEVDGRFPWNTKQQSGSGQ
jgi:uncharacterized membrane protein